MPDQSKNKNYYGVTEDGTVYFSAMAPGFYGHLFQLFLEEFFGVPYDSGAKSEGCAVTPFYRELPALDEAWLRQQGYEKVFVDEFEGDSLNQDNWSVISGLHVQVIIPENRSASLTAI